MKKHPQYSWVGGHYPAHSPSPPETDLQAYIKTGQKIYPRNIYKGLMKRLQLGGLEPLHVLSLSDYTVGNSTQFLNAGGSFATVPLGGMGIAPATTVTPVTTGRLVGTVTTRFANEDHAHDGVNSFGVSTGGNTLGNTTVKPGRFVLVGTNLTLSQATDATGATITISGGATATPTGFGVSTAGNTAGNTGTKTGTIVFVGSNIISLSQATDANGATVTIDATAAGGAISVVSKLGVSNLGNTAGNTATTYGQIVLAGVNAITLSQLTAAGSLATISISGPASATTVRAIAPANSVGTVGSRFALEDHAHAGVQDGGISTHGNTAGTTGLAPGHLLLVGTSNITLSQSSDAAGVTVSFIAPATVGPPARSFHEVMDGQLISSVISLTGASMSKRPIFFPFWLDGSLNAKTIEYWASRAGGTSLNMTHGIAFYTMVNSTSLALHSSTTEGVSLTTSAQYSGARIYGFTGLSNLTLTEGQWIGALYFSASNNVTDNANLVMYGGQSITSVAGYVFAGTNSTGATNVQSQVVPFWGVYSNTTAAFPANVNRTQIAGNGTNAVNADPYVVIRAI